MFRTLKFKMQDLSKSTAQAQKYLTSAENVVDQTQKYAELQKCFFEIEAVLQTAQQLKEKLLDAGQELSR